MEAKPDVGSIRIKLHSGFLTSVDLVNFYGLKCQTVGRELSLSTEEMFDSAMKKAKVCDQER